jgi:hypothetical protein
MKYMLLIHAGTTTEPPSDDPDLCPSGGSIEDFMAFDKAVHEAGIYVDAHSLADLTTATTVRVAPSGERSVTDGPFAETREVLGGYYVIDVPDLDVALDWAARCPGARGGGSVVVRPIAEF